MVGVRAALVNRFGGGFGDRFGEGGSLVDSVDSAVAAGKAGETATWGHFTHAQERLIRSDRVHDQQFGVPFEARNQSLWSTPCRCTTSASMTLWAASCGHGRGDALHTGSLNPREQV